MRSERLAKIAFALSAALLIWLYGFATSARQWFPNDLLVRAWSQAEAVVSEPVPHWRRSATHDRSGTRIVDRSRRQPGLTLVATWGKDSVWRQELALLDAEGRPRHTWRVDGRSVFPDPPDIHTRHEPGNTSIHGVHLFPNGDVLVNVSYVGTARLDACGRVLWRLPVGTHHSIARSEDGTFWITAGTHRVARDDTVSPTEYPGIDPTYRDRILHVSEDGRILGEIGILGLLYRNGLQRYMSKGSYYRPIEKIQDDLTHMNDVEPLDASMADEYPMFEAGDLVVSLHHLDLVLVVDPETKRVKWHASDPFIQQHDPDFIGDGWIGVFDNNRDGTERGGMQGGSRIVALQPHTDSTKILFPTSRSDDFYTDVQGKWQLLENGNMLLTEAQAGRVVEVAPDGRTVWEWIVPAADDGTVPEVTEGTRYDLTPEEVAAWPCSPEDAPPETTEQEVDA